MCLAPFILSQVRPNFKQDHDIFCLRKLYGRHGSIARKETGPRNDVTAVRRKRKPAKRR
jgi:hypothetical protein